MDKAHFIMASGTAASYNVRTAQFCILSTITFDPTLITDSADDFVGVTGRYYKLQDTKYINGGEVIQYVDETSGTIIAKGRVEIAEFLSDQSIQFSVAFEPADDVVNVTFSQIKRAFKNTGYGQNKGFQPVGNWGGTQIRKVYQAIEAVFMDLDSCIQEH